MSEKARSGVRSRSTSNGEFPIILKVCTLCLRVQKYNAGDCLPHWGDLTIGERLELTRLDTKKHHTICPDCHRAIAERDARLKSCQACKLSSCERSEQ